MISIREEYYVSLKGKKHPTYPGVLVALHENGLLGIEVNVLQYPSAENGNTAVCQATVTMPGPDGREKIYTEVGDASPSNVGSMIVPHIIRMAATRAKGRAGRDALALGVALVEELGPDSDETPSRTAQEPRQSVQRARHDPADHKEQKPQVSPPTCSVCGEPVDDLIAGKALKRWHVVFCIQHGKEKSLAEAQAAVNAATGKEEGEV